MNDLESLLQGLLPWGGLDFLHAHRPLAVSMLDRALAMPSRRLGAPVRVVRPEDSIGLKLQALTSNPARLHKETADIEALLGARKDLDWARVKEFFELFGQNDLYAQLEARCRA